MLYHWSSGRGYRRAQRRAKRTVGLQSRSRSDFGVRQASGSRSLMERRRDVVGYLLLDDILQSGRQWRTRRAVCKRHQRKLTSNFFTDELLDLC